MAKKLNEKSIRQGQTVYVAVPSPIHSPPNVVISMLVCERRYGAARFVTQDNYGYFTTYSRRKAERKAKQLNHYAGVGV